MVYSKIDGVVKTSRSLDQAREEQLPAVLISGGGGYYVTGAMSETELQTLHVGDTVTVMSWQTYSQTEAEIVSISGIPGRGRTAATITGARATATLRSIPSLYI